MPTNELHRCPRCGAEISAQSLAGNCPNCLIREFAGPIEPPIEEAEETPLGQVGEFHLLEEIGRGSMGVVYRARQQTLGRLVALKVLGQGMPLDPSVQARFKTEINACALLNHPNVVSMYQFGEHGNQLFFAMELVEGDDLGRIVQTSGPLPARRAADLAAQICDALQQAHQRGVIHRDLKPSNILLNAEGSAKVADFGLARILDGASVAPLTLAGQILGTPAYMAPEQASGQARDVGPAADIYAVGAVLFYLLTGRSPFVGENLAEILNQVVHQDPPSPRLLNPAVPSSLATISLKCLAKEPGRRYGSARETAEDLRRFLRGEAILAKPVGPITHALLWTRRHPAWTAVLLLSAIALGTAVLAWFNARTSNLLDQQRRLSDYIADINLARQALSADNLVRAQDRLERQVPRIGAQDLRGFEWWWLKELARGQEDRLLFQSTNPITALAISRSAPYFAAAGDGWLRIWGADGRLDQTIPLQNPGEPLSLAFSDDGTLLSVAWTNRVNLYTHSGQLKRTWDGVGGNTLAFSPTGKRLAVNHSMSSASDDPKDVVALDLEDGNEWRSPKRGGSTLRWDSDEQSLQLVRFYGSVNRWRLGTTNIERILVGDLACYSSKFSPSGHWLARAFYDGSVAVQPSEGNGPVKKITGQAPRGVQVAFGGEGERWLVLAGGSESRLDVWNTTNWTHVARLVGHIGEISGVQFLGDETLLSSSRDGTLRMWNFNQPRRLDYESVPHQLKSFNTRAPLFSKDGHWLAAPRIWAPAPKPVEARDDCVIWDRVQHKEWTNLPGRPVSFSPDGARLLTWRQDGQLQIWDLASGKGETPFRMANPSPHWHEDLLSADGTWLIGHDTERKLHAYDAFTGAKIATASKHCWAWTVSPNNALAAYATPAPENEIILWDLETHRERLLLKLDREAPELRFSPDRRWLAVGGTDHQIHLIDLTSGITRKLIGHQAAVMTLDFSPDSRTLASGGDDLDLVLWNVESGRELLSRAQPGPIYWVRFAPDGQSLLSGHLGTFDGQIPSEYRIWPAPRQMPPKTSEAHSQTNQTRQTVWMRRDRR